jgi:hypothetical protein
MICSGADGDIPAGALISVTAVTESGLMTMMTGFPALSFARTMKASSGYP